MFYINYEECKLKHGLNVYCNQDGFILTMRNVNILEGDDSHMITIGFILTMRNVNL